MSFDGGAFKPISRENMSAKDFASLSMHEQANIKNAKFTLPKFGKKGFGFFVIEYNTPILRKEEKFG